MIIYKITNLLNNKIYVGQTTQSIERRWARHCSKSNCGTMAISRAIQKYGVDNFKIEKICKCNSLDQLNITEKYYIAMFNSIIPNGYNLLSGGKNGLMTQETKDKISSKLTGLKKTPEHIKKIIENRRNTYFLNPDKLKRPPKGIYSSNYRSKLSKSKKKKSQFIGVTPDRTKWRAEFYHQGKKSSKTYITEEAAAHAYDYELIQCNLNPINFPHDLWNLEKLNQFRSKKRWTS